MRRRRAPRALLAVALALAALLAGALPTLSTAESTTGLAIARSEKNMGVRMRWPPLILSGFR